ncbi:DHA2 family efflux MFS transporter permease subunit [Acidocella sp.]|uniref:DHA2 family efflux MFS transporter permease subunit n=1 Tax=Acidocella sp. TaxID=50710 RepID=UPI002626C7D6|nr:DHA2 family efflux MFS transporter permease subunit [Acidocella sp.]
MSKGGHNPWAVAIVVTLAAFMEVLDTTIVNVSLPHMAGSLSVSNDDATWALTTYLVANSVVLTISGSLSRLIGRKRFFLICIGIFTIASFGCGVSTSFPELLLFRAIQGFFGGGLQPLQQAIILDVFPPESRSRAFSLTALAIIVAPVLGPLAGGWLTDTYSWHLIFLINVPVGLITFFGVMHFVEDSEEIKREQANAPPFDYIGTIFIFLALGCLQIGMDRGEDYDWFGSMFIRVTLGISFLSFLFGCLYLLYTRHPAVDLRVLKDRNFAFGFVQIGIVGLTLYSSSVLIPQFTQQQLGYTSMLAGLVLAPGAVVLMFLIPMVGLAMNYLSPKMLIVLGGAALAASLFYSMDLVPDDSFDHLVILRATQTIGLAFLFVPISTVAYFTLPNSKQGDAAALFSMSRNIFGGIGISIATAIVTERAQVHQTYLVDHLLPSPGYDSLLARLEQAYQNHGVPAVATASQAIKQVYQMLQTQEAVLAYIDVFWYTGLLALVLIPTALLMHSGAGQHKASGK